MDNGELQNKHIALGSELETTLGLGSAPRLMGNDFCSALSLAKLVPSNMSLVLFLTSKAFQVASLSALNTEEGCEVFTGLLSQESERFTYKDIVGQWG